MAKRVRITIHGMVQGVGFRPFVYRLANAFNLTGWVINDTRGVTIEVEGQQSSLDHLLHALQHDMPPHSYYEDWDIQYLEPVGFQHFEIRKSANNGSKQVLMLPDIATCPECLKEIFDPNNRRYLYPFTNCTHCGPRFSIITGLPYDRRQTTMTKFTMCDHCRQEYEDPENRRFHAQPNACPDCGPQMELWDPRGCVIVRRHKALKRAASAIKHGQIVALKGLGGFQLLAIATNDSSVERLRLRKNREDKPFAMMVTSLAQAHKLCSISKDEEALLKSPQAPIVILNRKNNPKIPVADAIAPEQPTLGIMLPYTPMHHILMRLVGAPVVATSGNISDEPICTDEHEALERLRGIADLFLVHDRPIERHVDDSVVRIIASKPSVLRRARGYAPHPVSVKTGKDLNGKSGEKDLPTVLALGGHLKNSIAVNRDANLFISQHIGDLNTYEATKAYHKVTGDLPRLYDLHPDLIIHDLHPGYYTSKDAMNRNLPTYAVQHHYAHILSCMAEHGLEGPVLGVAWDGTGYGTDETIWGGEFILCDQKSWKRVATFRSFRLPGGDTAIREPRRSALGMLFEMLGNHAFQKYDLPTINAFSGTEIGIMKQMLQRGINSPVTTSAGRIFDAITSLLDIRHKITFEGQAAMALEHLIPQNHTKSSYSFEITSEENIWIIDWEPTIQQILAELPENDPGKISMTFHNTLSDIIIDIAKRIGEKTVVLSGGCFQNEYLTEHTVSKLERHGFLPYWHQQIPPNDGGIAVGQLYYALCNTEKLIKEAVHDEVP